MRGLLLRALRDLPIKQKVLVIVLVTTAAALLLAGVAIVATDAVLFRIRMERDLSTLADIVGENCTAALTFDDPHVASENLAALQERQYLIAACLDRPNGSVFAEYERPGAPRCPTPAPSEQVLFTSRGLIVSHPILLEHRRVGTLVLLYGINEFTDRLHIYGGIVLLILIGSILAAFILSSRLRDIIATPISRLAHAAGSISETGNYGIRVERDSPDELGVLVDAFNQMLGRIESRDIQVQNARNLLQTTLSSIGDAVISTDVFGHIVFANPVARALLRRPGQEIAGESIGGVFRIVNEFSRTPVENPVDKVLREGSPAGLANHTILIAADGSEIPIDDSAAPIRQGSQIVGVVLVFRDISERRRAQRDAAYLAAIVDSSEDAIIGCSPAGIIQSWNPGAERLFGYRAGEVIGRPLVELVPPDRREEEAGIMDRLRAGGSLVQFETVRVRKDGSPIDVSIAVSPIRDKAGQIIGVSQMVRDITEQKRDAEQMRQTQKLESLGVLAGGIAHDFNNLLTGILGNASLALDDLPPGTPAREPVEALISASERAAQLARQMLAYSGKGHFVLERVDFSARVRETLPLIKSSIPAHVELRLDLGESLPPVEADGAQLQQLMMNIIINGAESIPEGAPGTVTITTRAEEVGKEGCRICQPVGGGELPPGRYVLFQVADTGAGMDEETRARIFDPFFTTKFTGRGLGLAAVLGIVRGHHGAIEVSSALGEGTIFRVLFPAAANHTRQPLAPPARDLDLHGAGLILVVDDEQTVRSVARQALERYGYKVLLAEDGARGLDVFQREAARLQCVVLDLTMPVMSGEETLARMKAVSTTIPIILSSGFNEAQAVRQFEGKGLAGFLQKPYKSSVLLETIKRVISEASAAQFPPAP
ncbi:MAG TPA: PAS domain S-box protein [Bryobacteraceae bacterium]|nr:PAS domain S-box protein [Bryobacteraceae bacterium]